MNNVEIEDVYHHDFTTASEWEVFIARLEELIHEWKLPQRRIGPPLKHGDFINLPWDETSDKLNFADVEFRLKHFKLRLEEETTDNDCILVSEEQEDCWTQCQKDVLNASNDFVQLDQNHLEIARYYGIREFLVLVPSKKSSILDETRIKILLSSLTIAVSNARCELPAFVQAQESWQKFYLGVNVGKGSRMHLNMVHLKKIPPHCRHLTGLLSLFKQKINEGCGIQLDPVIVSVRLTYSLKDWTSSTWTQEPPDFDFLQGETLGVDELGKLPFGATFDPIKEFQLFVSWPEICENVVVDSESFSDLEPLSAPEWALQVEMVPGPACLLGEYLSNFLLLCSNPKSLTDILGDGAAYTTDNDNQSIGSAFNILTESKIPSISTVVHRATSKSRKNVEGPITEDVLLPILYFVFPDAEGKSRAAFMSSTSSVDQGTSSVGPSTAVGAGNSATAENVSGAGNNSSIDDQWRGIKTCAVDSLVWRLAVVAAHCAYNLGGQAALAQLWHEFVQEVRFRWEKGIMLPGVGAGFPDCVRTCLLHQKLQMINCCIARKKAREEVERKVQGMDINADSSGDSEEDEFFECLNEDEGAQSRHQLLWNRPVGRLAKHPTLRLVQTGEPLYLPVTQDPVPKTEDQLEEDAQVMMQLGTDKNASEMRARLMSASLLSDMESFKAANPSAQLEDFIRWYSPRDWIEDADSNDKDEWGQTPGRLSARMLIPNNPWASTWTSAQPVPAYRQKRLFDDTREAEKVIHFLTNKRLGQVGQLLLPVLTHAALVALHEKKTSSLQGLPDVLQAIHSRLQFATKPIQQKLQLYEDIIRDMESVETLVAQMNSLQLKLSDNEGDAQDKELQAFVVQLMRGKEVSVPNGPRGALGNRISKMFADAQKAAHTSSTGGGGAGGGSSGGGNSSDSDAMYDPRSMAFKPFPAPTCKEFVLRAMAPRPSPTSIAQPQRLYVSLDKDNIRMAGAFSEDTIFY